MPNTEPYGPLTTSALDGAGGPLNGWDQRIADLQRHGIDPSGLIASRARLRAIHGPEKVWVPTAHQRAFYGMVAFARSGR